jgi:hypothetical protein
MDELQGGDQETKTFSYPTKLVKLGDRRSCELFLVVDLVTKYIGVSFIFCARVLQGEEREETRHWCFPKETE